MRNITRKRLQSLLDYDPATGIFTWKQTRTFTALAGTRAGCKTSTGYTRIKVDGQEYLAHRLAWIFIHGRITKGKELDHINGIRNDNRLANLREVTSSQQRMNSKLNADNTSGCRGVVKDSRGNGRWRVFIQREFIGSFQTLKEAELVSKNEFDKRFGPEYRRA